MAKWRVIMTDTESMTGVAPVCPVYEHGEHDVLDCCPHPHIETYGEADARILAETLNAVADGEGAEICT